MTLTDITDGYSVQLSNPSYTFAGTDSGVDGTQSVTTTVYAMRGSETVVCTVNASAIVKPAGMSITSDSASPSPTLTITASSVITTGGVINIPIVIPTNDGDLTYVRQFSYSISKSGVSPTVDISKDEETGTTTIVIVDAVGTHTAEIGDGLNQATVNLYQRGATAPIKPGAMTYTFATGELDGELGNWSPTVPNGDEICWVTTVSAISTGPVDFIQASEWSEPSRFNSSGMNQATLYLYRRGPSVPSISTPMTYDFTTGILSDVPSGWQRSIPSNSSGQACWVTSASVLSRSSTATIAYTSWSTPTKFVEDGSSVFVKSVEKHGTVTTMVIEDASGEHEITINDGEDGDEGVPGKYGYVHTAWANSADGQTDFSTSVSADKKYLGSYTDNTAADSQDPSMYSWSLIKGVGLQSTTTYYALSTSKSTHPPITDETAWSTTAPEAPYGYYIWMYIETVYDDGKVFNSDPAVISGKTLYTWIKYAKDDQGTDMSDNPTGMDYMGIAYNKDTPVESYVASDYDWCLYKGDKGIQGPPGTSYYTWIKYADDSEGHGMSDSPVGKKYIGLAHNKDTDVESTTPSDYVWSLIQGENGRAIEKIDEYYKVSSSYTDPPTGTWSKNTPEVMTPTLKFLWNYEVISYNDGSEPTTTAKRVIGAYGEKGTDGKGITQIQNWYLAIDESSDVDYDTEGWTTTIQTMTEDDRYLWNYEVTTFSDGSSSRSLPCIIGVYGEKGQKGDKGDTGIGVTSTTEQYCLIDSGSTPDQDTTWSETPPTYVQGRAYWTRTVTSYSAGPSTYSAAVKNNALTDANRTAAAADGHATQALNSANGKNAIFYGSNAPTATAAGDLWYVLGTSEDYNNKITALKKWDGSSWVEQPLTSAAFSFIDAGKINVGTLSTITIWYNNNNYWDLSTGVFKTNKGTFTGAVNATSLTLGSDAHSLSASDVSGLASVATSGRASDISGLATVATTGSYNNLSNKPTIPTSVTDLTGGANIVHTTDISISESTDTKGVTTTTVNYGSGKQYSVKTSSDGKYVLVGRAAGTGGDPSQTTNDGTIISTAGLLTARNAVIYGTVYATDGSFKGKVEASQLYVGGTNGISYNGSTFTVGSNFVVSKLETATGDYGKIKIDNSDIYFTKGRYGYPSIHLTSTCTLSYTEDQGYGGGIAATGHIIGSGDVRLPSGNFIAYDGTYSGKVRIYGARDRIPVGSGETDTQRVAIIRCNSTTIQINAQYGNTGNQSSDFSFRNIATSTSDRSLKENITDSTKCCTDVIRAIRHRDFYWKDSHKHIDVGYIAQELEEIDERLVVKPIGDGDYYGVETFYLQGVMTKAMQEMLEEIDILKEKITQLENRR